MDKLLGFIIFISIIGAFIFVIYKVFHKEKSYQARTIQNQDRIINNTSDSSVNSSKSRIVIDDKNEETDIEDYDILLRYDEEPSYGKNQDDIDFDFIPFEDSEDFPISNSNKSSICFGDVINQIDSLAAASEAGKKKGSASPAIDEAGSDGPSEDVIKALETLIKAGKASTTFLQNKLGWSYPKAARIMNELEECGYIAPKEGNKERRVLITLGQWYDMSVSVGKEKLDKTSLIDENYSNQVKSIKLSENIKHFPNLLVESSNLKQFKVNVDNIVRQVSPEDCKFVIANIGYIKNFSKTDYSYFLEVPIIENSKKILGALGWAVKEMESRYIKLSENNFYNISEYNDFINSHWDTFLIKMHYIFFVIDEIFNNGMYKEKEFLSSVENLILNGNKVGIKVILGTESKVGSLKKLGLPDTNIQLINLERMNVLCSNAQGYEDVSSDIIDDGYDFENKCAGILEDKGYKKVSVTKASGDQGVDITAERDGIKYAFQCKYYSNPVGNKAVQEIFSGIKFYNANVGVIITNNTFTDSAVQLANQLGIILWDKNSISEYL